jgi:hypothetical protein
MDLVSFWFLICLQSRFFGLSSEWTKGMEHKNWLDLLLRVLRHKRRVVIMASIKVYSIQCSIPPMVGLALVSITSESQSARQTFLPQVCSALSTESTCSTLMPLPSSSL